MSIYSRRGVSAQKGDVHKATAKLDKGLYPQAFCKLYPDLIGGDAEWINIMHADGAGTKSILAYLYWKETGDISVWKGIAKDAIVMNLDDLLCTGIYNNILFSSTIDRNRKLVPGEILETIINGTQECFDELRTFGIDIQYLGGETADVGDVVRTIAVNGTMCARWPKNKLITNEKIRSGDVIVGLSSSGQCTYETEYNSGIASNGLTSARHDVLHRSYGLQYPESFDPSLDQQVVYLGKHHLTDTIEVIDPAGKIVTDIGHLLLSATRTYGPVLKTILEEKFDDVHGLIHCSGGGQTKCMKYLPADFRIIKDNLFESPIIFKLIQESSGSDLREMYQVFNMGHRLEIFTDASSADEIISMAKAFDIEGKIVGRVEAGNKKELFLRVGSEEVYYG